MAGIPVTRYSLERPNHRGRVPLATHPTIPYTALAKFESKTMRKVPLRSRGRRDERSGKLTLVLCDIVRLRRTRPECTMPNLGFDQSAPCI
jgi:hypothetical protein